MPKVPLIALSVLLVACAGPRPDLGRLYAMQANPEGQPPLVLIHGMLGSRLIDQDSGRELWPGSTWKILFHDYRSLALEIDGDTLEPLEDAYRVRGITDRAAGRDFYGRLIDVLRDAGGYEERSPGQPVREAEKSLYVFAYDWRQDIVKNVRELDAFIDAIRRDHDQPDLKVDVVAHSMGGLLTRYYIRYGTLDVLDDNEFPVSAEGGARIRRAIFLGTPSLGSVKAIQTMLEGFPVGLDRVPPEVLATFPSAYQLLPHPINRWLVKTDGSDLDRDLFDVEFWRRFEFSIFDPKIRARIAADFARPGEAQQHLETMERYFEKRLERGRRFVWSLTVPMADPPLSYAVFGGDCALTPARVLVEEVGDESEMRLWPDQIENPLPGVDYDALMLEPGDGVVTKASLLARQELDPTVARHRYSFFPLGSAFFLCERHDALTGNINFQDNLLHVLLSADEPDR